MLSEILLKPICFSRRAPPGDLNFDLTYPTSKPLACRFAANTPNSRAILSRNKHAELEIEFLVNGTYKLLRRQ